MRFKLGLLLSVCVLTTSACSGGGGSLLPSVHERTNPGAASRTPKSYACPVFVTGDGTVIEGSCSGDGSDPGGSFEPCAPDDLICLQTGGGGSRGGGGRGSSPPPYGTQGSCASGFIFFSGGCEDDGVAFDQNYAAWFNPILFFEANYVIRFDATHYWNRHLACYLKNSTPDQWASAASLNFYLSVYSYGNAPAQGTYKNYTFSYSDGGTSWQTTYRVYAVSANAFYDVPTAYIVGMGDCP